VQAVRGLGLGGGTVALALGTVIFCLVAYLAITRRDMQSVERVPHAADEARMRVELSPESLD
jgi:hypothetical protein